MTQPMPARTPGIRELIIIGFGIAIVLLFVVNAILLGSDDWIDRSAGLSLFIVVPAYVRAIRRIIAWRDFLDQHALYDPRWSR